MSAGNGCFMSDSEEEARLYLQVGSQEIDLKGTMREVNDEWIRIKDQDTWASALSKIRIARQEAIDASVEAMTKQGIPESGSAFNRLIDNCGIHKTADIILAAVHFLRSVEKQNDSPPRVVKRLLTSTGKWTEEEIEKWNISLYMNRMIEGGSGMGKSPLLTYPPGTDKNRYAILTDAGIDHLERLSA